jgi:hypothetical protein
VHLRLCLSVDATPRGHHLALLDLLGCSLTTIALSSEMHHIKRALTNLLKGQPKLEKLVAPWSAAYGLAEAIASGYCRSLKDLCLWQVKATGLQKVVFGTEYLCFYQVTVLVDALGDANVLPVLTSFTSIGPILFRNLDHLKSQLSTEGILPSLKRLAIEDKSIDHISVDQVLANMIEAWAALKTCVALEKLGGRWFHGGFAEDRADICCACCFHR